MNNFFYKANLVHNFKYDYSKSKYINSRTKLCIICPKHGEFWQTPSNHIQGTGCPMCKNENIGNKRRLSKEDFINKSRKVHGNKYDYSKVEYKSNSTKVCIICPEHGEFWQIPNNHLKGTGCPKCVSLNNNTTEEFIEKAKDVHGDKYDYSKVNYINSHTKVCIICPEHGEFWQTPHIHLRGSGCPNCGSIKSHTGKNSTTEEFIEKAKEIHGDKYDYSKVEYINSHTKVCIICPEHGEFWQSPQHHNHGCGCPKCKSEKTGILKKLTTDKFIEKSKEIYGDIYDYSLTIYSGYYNPLKIICKEHGVFTKKPCNFLQGQGCPICGRINYKNSRSYTTEDFILLSKKVHGDKYDYSKVVYNDIKTKVCIICPEHGEFWQSPDKHLFGQGCPKCGNSLSKNEQNINEYIKNELLINTKERNKTLIKPYELDIFVPSKNIAIEYNGLIWHSEKFGKDYNYHLNKTELCEKQGIRLIHIFDDEWLEHNNIVKSKIRHILGCENNLPKIYARKCNVETINKKTAERFLISNHLQGLSKSTIYLGCYHNKELIGVMSFRQERKDSDKWELTRFATDINKHCIGIGGKIFSYFVKNYNPYEVKSFADRRWTLDKDNNLYTKLGFKLEQILKPEYRYTNGHTSRIHKFNFRKERLLKKYPNSGLTGDMTETEMAQRLGFYKIWDCGLYKYVWKNNHD